MNAPVNKLLVSIEKKLYDSRTFKSGQTIYFDPSWHPEEHAMLEATVMSVPISINKRKDYDGYVVQMVPGDKILIRYDVVFSYRDQPDRDTPVYKNLLFLHNEATGGFEEVWLCDILQVFAIIKEGRYFMVNGFVMLDIITETLEDFSKTIIRPGGLKENELKHMAKVIASSNPDIAVGDTVFINPQTVMCYQLNQWKFYIIKEQYILGRLQ